MASTCFTFEDFIHQMTQIPRLGSMSRIEKWILGHLVGSMIQDESVVDREINIILWVHDSMTPEQRRMPEMVRASRRQRIARAAGVSVTDVSSVLRQYETRRRMTQPNDARRSWRGALVVLGLVTNDHKHRDPSTPYRWKPELDPRSVIQATVVIGLILWLIAMLQR